jgi:hypothetical protein
MAVALRLAMRASIPLLMGLAACIAPDQFSSREEESPVSRGSSPSNSRADAGGAVPTGGDGCDVSTDPFDVGRIRADVTLLASPALGGRSPGSSGDVAARAYIEQRFRCLGLQPAGEGGSFQLPFTNRAGSATANVVAFLPGNDTIVGSEIVVLGAHHDHFGTLGDKGLRLGANDDASGIAGLLAAAQAFKQNPKAPRRTVVFAAFGSGVSLQDAPFAEGAAAYVGSPPLRLPTSRVVMMVDLDGIGTYSAKEKLFVTSGSRSNSGSAAVARAAGLKLSNGRPDDSKPSDYYPFCDANIPVVVLSTEDPDCHRKACDIAERLDYPHLAQISRVASDATRDVADSFLDLRGLLSSSFLEDCEFK